MSLSKGRETFHLRGIGISLITVGGFSRRVHGSVGVRLQNAPICITGYSPRGGETLTGRLAPGRAIQ